MASASPATPSTKETTNYARLCRVLVDVGTCALRDCFDSICTPPTLHTVLAASQPALQSLRSRRIINATQWGKLFPAIPASVSSRDFDITLLMTLLRNICGLTPPVTGWDVLPAATDLSREADIARIKYFRNTVYAHAEHASVDDATFDTHWKEIRDTLVRLGGATYKVAVDNLEVCCMDPDMEHHYKELLQLWKNDEDNIKDELKEIGTDVKDLTKKLDELVASTGTPVGQSSDEDGNGPKLEETMDTIFMCREPFHENGLLTFYCKKCKVCICEKCRQTRHTHHTTVDVHQAAEQPKVDIEEVVEEMKRKIADCTERVEKTKESWRKSRESVATSRNKVMTYVEGIIRILQEHEKAMMTSLDVIDGKVQREHAAQLEHLETFRNQLQEHVEWCEGILQRKKNVEILQTHNDFIGRSRGLRNTEKLDIYKPSHVRYEINKENLETVSSVVPEVGRVVISSTDPSQSVAEGTGLQEGDVGSKAIIKITTKDSDGNQCQDENDQIFVKIRPPLEKELIHTIAPVKNGEYSVTYTPDCAGEHEVLIAVNGEPLTGSPWLVHVTLHRYKYSFSLGSCGKGQGQFKEPCSIAIDDVSGKVAVADRKRVQLFSLEGTYLTDVGSKKLTGPSSLAFSKIGELIVIASDKMFCFSESLEFVKYIINKQLKQPHHLTIARDGRMVVCDGGDNTVKILSSDGSQVLLSVCHHDGGKIPVCAVYHQNKIFASYSSGLKVFSKNGAFLYAITYPKSILDFDILQSSFGALAIDRFNNLLIHHRLLCSGLFSCYTEGRIQIFTLDGKLVNTIQEEHTRFRLSDECSVAVSSTGLLFVADFHNHRVHVFQ